MAAKQSRSGQQSSSAARARGRKAADALTQPGAQANYATDCVIGATLFATCSPRLARLDLETREVVYTQRFGGTIILQKLSLNSFCGVVAELSSPALDDRGRDGVPSVALVLQHPTRMFSIRLVAELSLDEAVVEWRKWSDRLSLGMILTDVDGSTSTVRDHLGALVIQHTEKRRLGASKSRRPRFTKRRGIR